MPPKEASKLNGPVRVAGYVRVSTEEQASEGLSLDNQKSRIKAYAESQGWQLCEIFREEGHSGKSINRPKLKRLIAEVKSGNYDVVLVYKVDRLTRKQKDLWFLLEDIFEAHQTGFKSVIEPFDTTSAQGKAFLGMLAVFAQLERDTISERTKDTLENKRSKGEWVGRIPFGFRLISGRLERDPRQQKVIARIRKLARNGYSYRSIADQVGVSHVTVSNLLNSSVKRRNSLYSKGLAAGTVK